MDIVISVVLFVLGAVMGSFGCCQVWRMRKKDKSRWSHCMECGQRLKARDNIPVASWVMLGGKCRKCGKKIGVAEILSEVGLGVMYVLSYWLWPFGFGDWWSIAGFGVFLVFLVGLLILFIYDARWSELPVKTLTFCVVCVMVLLGLRIGLLASTGLFSAGFLWSFWGALAILPGLYFALYKISKEKWVGGGDWLVALMAALLVSEWWLALFVMFLANFMGAVVGIVGKKKRMAFGPYLIIAMLVVFFAQDFVMKLLG